MIFDITIEDNDFTHILAEYFKRNRTFQFRFNQLMKIDKPNHTEYILRDEAFKRIDKIRTILCGILKPTKEDKEFLVEALKMDIILWIKEFDFLDDRQRNYIIENLSIKATDTFKIKDENGEHLYVYTHMDVDHFTIIQ